MQKAGQAANIDIFYVGTGDKNGGIVVTRPRGMQVRGHKPCHIWPT